MPRKPYVPTPEEILEDVVANNRLSGYEVPEDIKDLLLRIARGEITADEVVATVEQRAEQRRRLALEAADQIEPFAHVASTPKTEELRARFIAGEITAEEAVAAIDEEIRKIIQ